MIACAVMLLGACLGGLGAMVPGVAARAGCEGFGRSSDRVELAVIKEVPADSSPARPSVEARVGAQVPANDGPRLRGPRLMMVALLGQQVSPPSGTIRAVERGPMLRASGSQLVNAHPGVAPRPPPTPRSVAPRAC